MKLRQGFSILENLISIVLISVMLTVVVSAYGSLVASKVRSRYIWSATQYARESMETIINAFQQADGWKFFSNHLKDKPKTACNRIRIMFPSVEAGYRFNEGKKKEPVIEGLYERNIQFCSVYRDTQGKIVVPDLGKFDRNTALIKVTVSPKRPGMFEPIELVTYIANLTGKTYDDEEDDEDSEDESDEDSETEEETL